MAEQPAGLCVLIADDDADAARALADLLPLLSARPMAVMVASDGGEALRLATGPLRPHAVVLDIEMPVMDGFQAATRIKKALGEACPLLIAVSGHGGHVEVAEGGGLFDHSFLKPVDPDDLARLLISVAEGGG